MSGKESIKKWVLGMGASVRVLEPRKLREEVIEEGEEVVGDVWLKIKSDVISTGFNVTINIY